jgi:hypothetical protein
MEVVQFYTNTHTHTKLPDIKKSTDLFHSSQASPACPDNSSVHHWCKNTKRENQRSGRKICPSATLSTTNLTWIDLGFHYERPATSCLNCPPQNYDRPGVECLLGLMARYASVCGYQYRAEDKLGLSFALGHRLVGSTQYLELEH